MKSNLSRYTRKVNIYYTGVYILTPLLLISLFTWEYFFESGQKYYASCPFQIKLIKDINLAHLITAIVGYIGIGFGYYTINSNKLAEKEKNSLEIEKKFHQQDIIESFVFIGGLRKQYLKNDGVTLDKDKIDEYMSGLASFDKHAALKKLESLSPEENSEEIESLKTTIKSYSHVVTALNAIESCANGIRYNIYDEFLLYNVYGLQIISIYEATSSFISTRQIKAPSNIANMEWLSVKWTLEKDIYLTESGKSSKREEKTLRTVKNAKSVIESYSKNMDKKPLKKILRRIKKYKYPG